MEDEHNNYPKARLAKWKEQRKLEEYFFLAVYQTDSPRDWLRNFGYVATQAFKGMFLLEIVWRMDVFEGKNNCYRKQLAKLGRNKFLQSRPRAAMFVTLNLARYLATSEWWRDASRWSASQSPGVSRNIVVLSYLKLAWKITSTYHSDRFLSRFFRQICLFSPDPPLEAVC